MPHTMRALMVLRAVNAALESADTEQQLLDEACHIAIDVGGYHIAWVGYTHNNPEQSGRLMAQAGHNNDYLNDLHASWGNHADDQDPSTIAIHKNQPSIVQDIGKGRLEKPWQQSALKHGSRSIIALPLHWRNETFGCLTILSHDPDAFDQEEAGLLGELASSLSYGINVLRTGAAHEKALLELRAERDTQQVVSRILNLSLEKLSLEEKLDRTLELLFDIPWMALERKGSVFLADEAGRSLRLVSRRHLSENLHTLCANVPYGHCLCGRAASTGELVFHAHVDESHETSFDGIGDHGHYCQPIKSGARLLGVLNVYLAAGHQCRPEEITVLESVSNTLAGIIERESSEREQHRLLTLLEATPDLVTITDASGHCLYYNDSAQSLLGNGSAKSHDSRNLFDQFDDKTSRTVRDIAYPSAKDAGVWEGEVELQVDAKKPLPFSMQVMSHRDSHGEVAYFSVIARDIRDRLLARKVAEDLAVREQQLSNTIINSLPGIFFLIDEETNLIRWNSNLETLLGYHETQLRQMPLKGLLAHQSQATMAETTKRILSDGNAAIEVELLTHDDRAIPFYLTGTLIEHADTGKSIVGIGIDISYRKQLEEELLKRAITDSLTGIFNRLKIEETLEHELKRSERYDQPLSIAMFDIDHFKQVNDNHGHDAGDEVLKAIVSISQQQLRDSDSLARWGGEEFILVSPETPLENMYQLVERIRSAIEEKTAAANISVTASFGVVQFKKCETQKALLKRVDDALYLAKELGRNQVRVAS